MVDSVVLYRDDDCDGWIAHSLRTDQIGIGVDLSRALADLMQAVNQIMQAASEDPSLDILRDAPAEIRQLAKRSKPLPREVYEVAYKMVSGQWPDEMEVHFQGGGKRLSYTADELELTH